ncbi:DUF6931 family protein [Photobacterium minamisatsumaniensis]|uniref:DUF6931 family protein n=1 Tax=Photobacterium minamisatsumaniensis TaxID=2910233 RepID=UPI003D109B32
MKKIPYSNSAPIFAHFELSEEAEQFVEKEAAPIDVIEQLKEAKCFIELANFFAHALPVREAIWWCVHALKVRQQEWTAAELRLIDDCMLWVRDPNEAIRRSIEQQISKLDDNRAPKWLGQSVFWSGTGSIAPADNPVVMPVEHLYAKAVAGAVNTAAVLPEWNDYQTYYQRVFSIALDLANGGSGTSTRGND